MGGTLQNRNVHLFYVVYVKNEKNTSSCWSHADACRTNWSSGTFGSAGQLEEVTTSVLEVTDSLKLITVHV